jgi:phosphoenolpyruvate carboxykinase (ATP)
MPDQSAGLTQLEKLGLDNIGSIYWNFSAPALYEESVRRREGWISSAGPLVVHTGHHTGRSPGDKFIVKDEMTAGKIDWGKVNRPFEPEAFDSLFERMLAYFQGRDIFVQNLYGGADPRFRIPVRIITDYAWQSLFIRNLLIRPDPPVIHTAPETFTILDSPRFHATPETDKTNSEVFIILNFAKRIGIIGGTSYAGEIKKSVFTILNYLLPAADVFPMHCSANVGPKGDVALFFGLSGTGKTTLSAVPDRALIGDDEHGWSDKGIFNFEGGCYAKVIKLSPEAEPDIFQTTRTFGTVLENVMINIKNRDIDLDNGALTENTRAAYPLTQVPNRVESGMAGHPKNVIMLTADAFGVLPPISKLTPEQAMYHFLSGYTAKVAGTEKGVKEPQTTFSTCFGAPFMPLPPTVYASLLGKRLLEHKSDVWLVNTGWTGGPYGVGSRMKIAYTRAMVRAVLDGALASVPMVTDPVFGLQMPTSCPDVPAAVLNPKSTWANASDYEAKAAELAAKFKANFQQFADKAPAEVTKAGPR